MVKRWLLYLHLTEKCTLDKGALVDGLSQISGGSSWWREENVKSHKYGKYINSPSIGWIYQVNWKWRNQMRIAEIAQMMNKNLSWTRGKIWNGNERMGYILTQVT